MRTLLLAALVLGGVVAAMPGAAAADLFFCVRAQVGPQPAEVCGFPDAVGPPLPKTCHAQARTLAGGLVWAKVEACVM